MIILFAPCFRKRPPPLRVGVSGGYQPRPFFRAPALEAPRSRSCPRQSLRRSQELWPVADAGTKHTASPPKPQVRNLEQARSTYQTACVETKVASWSDVRARETIVAGLATLTGRCSVAAAMPQTVDCRRSTLKPIVAIRCMHAPRNRCWICAVRLGEQLGRPTSSPTSSIPSTVVDIRPVCASALGRAVLIQDASRRRREPVAVGGAAAGLDLHCRWSAAIDISTL